MATTVAYPGVGGHSALTSTAGALLTVLDAVLVTGQGWTKPFQVGNVAVYKQPVGSNGFYLRVDDSGANFARACLYETMSDVNTGTGQTPTSVQLNGGYYIHKNSPGDWIAFANGGNFHIFTSYSAVRFYWFRVSEIISKKPADGYNTYIYGQEVDSTAASMTTVAVNPTTSVGGYFVRDASGTGGSTRGSQVVATGISSLNQGAMPAAPDPISGKYLLGKLRIGEGTTTTRGYEPGVLVENHAGLAFSDRSTLDGTAEVAGRTYMAVTFGTMSQQILIETSDNWGPF